MAIEKDSYTRYVPTCDMCGDTLQEEYDFYDAVNTKKAAGWRSKRIQGEWYDICPECQEKMNYKYATGAAEDFADIAGR